MNEISLATNETILDIMGAYKQQIKEHRRMNYILTGLILIQFVLLVFIK